MKTMLLLFVFAGLLHAGVYRDAGLGLYPFLKMDTGARVAALGGTGAINGGELAVFSNPALLSGRTGSVAAGYNQWYGTTSQSYLAAVAKVSHSLTGSLAFRSVYTSDLQYRESPTSDPLDTFTASDFSVNAALARRVGRFDLGVGLKFISEKIWLETYGGWAADFGFVYHASPSLVLSGAYLHSGPSSMMNGTEFRFPRTWVFAAGWCRRLPLGDFSLSAQVMRPLDNQTKAGVGVEYNPVHWVSIRGGWKFNDDSSDITAGAGFSAEGWTLDYAFVPGDYSLGTSHRFSVSRSL